MKETTQKWLEKTWWFLRVCAFVFVVFVAGPYMLFVSGKILLKVHAGASPWGIVFAVACAVPAIWLYVVITKTIKHHMKNWN